MMCSGCYKEGVEGYCPRCRKRLFEGKNVSHVLPFDAPKEENIPFYQEQTKRLSISGVQLKYSLRLEGKELQLTERNGQYILKPIPPAARISVADQAPENEHLTMQIADKVFSIQTAANGIIYFKDGTPAYITRRFDVRPDGSKYLQEDMAQISGRTRQKDGEHFKYDSTYEGIGRLIRLHVAAAMPTLESFFKVVLFNYLISNGDAHLKNFSLIQSAMGDHILTPAYDLMSTLLHVPNETDTALDLYTGSLDEAFYDRFGSYGQPSFRILAEKLGILPIRTEKILAQMLSQTDPVSDMIEKSLLSPHSKQAYINAFDDKMRRMSVSQNFN